MAIDSREKRQSISGIQHFMMVGVTPNASPDQEWRQEAGWGYPGILAQSPVAPTAVREQGFIMNMGRMSIHDRG